MEPSLTPNNNPMVQPPMPVMPNIPQFQHQSSIATQQANMMNQAFLSSYMQNTGMNSTSNRRQCVNMEDIKTKDAAIGNLITKAMRDDFEAFASTNLVDDEDFLYTLFMKSPSFSNQEYTLNLLSSLYRQKYENLYAKYPSLEVYTTFCLAVMLYSSENELKSICNTSTYTLPKAGTKINFKVMKRKATELIAPNETSEAAKKSNRSKVHPLFELEFYREHEALFKLGVLTKYCVPSEFALMFCIAHADKVSKYIKQKEKMDYDGVKCEFTRPVTVILKSRTNKDFVFTNVEHLDAVGKLLSAMTGYDTETDAFGLGIKTDMQLQNLSTNKLTKIDQKTRFDSGFNMAVISSFGCVGTESKTLNIRSYIDRVYSLDTNIVDVSDKLIAVLENTNASHAITLTQELEDYDNST